MATPHDGRKTRSPHVGGLDQPATAQRFRSTLEYMDFGPYNPRETSTLDVEISPLLRRFSWQRGGIIAQPGILSLKLLCVMAGGSAWGCGVADARLARRSQARPTSLHLRPGWAAVLPRGGLGRQVADVDRSQGDAGEGKPLPGSKSTRPRIAVKAFGRGHR
jgi:hypothetical protein